MASIGYTPCTEAYSSGIRFSDGEDAVAKMDPPCFDLFNLSLNSVCFSSILVASSPILKSILFERLIRLPWMEFNSFDKPVVFALTSAKFAFIFLIKSKKSF